MLERIARDAGVSPAPTLGPGTLQLLMSYAFPGNVRELENLLQRALAMSGGEVIESEDLGLPVGGVREPVAPALDEVTRPAPLTPSPSTEAAAAVAPLPDDLQAYLDEVERDILVRALERHRYNRTAAGASMGLSLRQMRYRMARLGVHTGDGLAE